MAGNGTWPGRRESELAAQTAEDAFTTAKLLTAVIITLIRLTDA